jgi:ATP-dependent RNA helicase RhlB
MSDKYLSDLAFSSLDLVEPLARGVAEAGFVRCTPIQAQTLPFALAGRDIAGQAQTGTGKTAAFLVAVFQRLLTEPSPPTRGATSIRALCIAPTRELAVQIFNDAEQLGRHTGLRIAVVFGGVDYEKQRRQLEEGVDVLIGTPGRLIDYYKQHVFDLRFVRCLVLDEADRMFDLGFIVDIRYVLRRLPPADQRQSMLFSATLSQRVLELAYEHMNDPELVRIEPEKITADLVRQTIYYPAMEEKIPLLIGLLRQYDAKRTMVFCNTKRQAERLEEVLQANNINAQAISGDVPQNKRLRFLKDFHAGDLAVLIATDVASRGLHVPDVSHVFNYDLPQDAADYVHRIGRTARAGAAGDAISFACEEYAISLPDIEKYLGRKIPFESITPQVMAPDVRFPPRGNRYGSSSGGFGGGGARRGGPGGSRGGPSGRGGGSSGGRGGPPPRHGGARGHQGGGGHHQTGGRDFGGAPSAPASDGSNGTPAPAAASSGAVEGSAGGPAGPRRRRRGGRGRSGGSAPNGGGESSAPSSGGDNA